ncbi:MAG: hypothetical protein CME71_10260 [Halobacteriovorax sp.]|nr:hypothetical protein [Halobacteriovorax sp.]|tara:strand:+ start:461 stop:1144 length:684 start_codon:yes stop_codon:yes gene_type:complete
MPSASPSSTIVSAALASQGDSDQFIYLSLLDVMKTTLPSCSSILDVGMGQGKFLQLLKSHYPSIELHGADAADYESLTTSEVTRHIQDFNQDIDLGLQFDVVTSIEVIEHLRDPRHFMTQLSNLTKANGTIVLTTPNNESYNSLLSFFKRGYFSAFSPRDYPAHITPITEYQLRQIVSEHSELEVLAVHYFKNGRIPGTRFKWRSIFPFLKGKRFADNFAIIIKKKA